MKNIASLVVIFLFLGTSVSLSKPAPDVPQQKVRTFINLLDYIGKDYPNAVQNGQVINDFEYQEMQNFVGQIGDLHAQLKKEINEPTFTGLAEDISRLKTAIINKAKAKKIAQITSGIRGQILKLNLVKVTPKQWPDLSKGKQIYEQRCQSCHGAKGFGDGPMAAQLDPPPTNFRDSANTDKLSPMQAYNTIRLGLEGTAMRSFSELSDQQVWDVAFYINALNYNRPVSDSLQSKIKSALADTASLRSISLYTNQQWKELFNSLDIDHQKGMAVVRGLTAHPSSNNANSTLTKALALLKKSQAAYLNGDYSEARQYALNAYLDGVEPEESQIRASDPNLVKKVETELMGVRSAIKNRVDNQQLKTKIQSATLAIQEAQNLLNNQEYSFWVNFLLAASILLREGLEAFLIIMVILNVLKSVEARHAAKYVHGGWVAAILLGIIGWFAVQSLVGFSSLQRELMEAIGAGIAVIMLVYIGFWMHSKTHASQWKQFITNRVHNLLGNERIWGLAILSFIVVFREAFESIIFLSSISIKSAGSNAGIFSALIAVAILITGIGYVFNHITKNIPVRQLFRYSSLMLAILAVILIGKGVRSLQEAGYIDIASLPFNWSVPTLGLYATWPTIVAQLALIGIIGGLWYYSNHIAARTNLESAQA